MEEKLKHDSNWGQQKRDTHTSFAESLQWGVLVIKWKNFLFFLFDEQIVAGNQSMYWSNALEQSIGNPAVCCHVVVAQRERMLL